jgi:hypothetical protein
LIFQEIQDLLGASSYLNRDSFDGLDTISDLDNKNIVLFGLGKID